MIKSMTGFGKAECILQNQKLIIEIKSLNSKFFDVNARIPNGYRDKELEIRNLLSARLLRGKVDFTLTIEESGETGNYAINKDLAKKYYSELKELSKGIENNNFTDYLPVIMRLPDVLVPQRTEISEEDWQKLKVTIDTALDKIDEFRDAEGSSLKKDMIYRTNKIHDLLQEVIPFEKQRIDILREKIKKDIHEIANKEEMDRNRLEQELVYYQDKLDITEEKVRLSKHCKYFLETLDEHESQGKKLGFISQEMGREINTLGAKANDASIQKIVVQMKDELEKIKEQLFNIL
ncbi:MAG: YicC family protein [Bacteroidales bacterium]|nr:YicC family protein [Bacteroidales bacterium]MCF8406162.1 YicC family protein [Bacteroidales bacterium]